MAAECSDEKLASIRAGAHPGCFVCDAGRSGGLGATFRCCGPGAVEAAFSCDRKYEGYPGYVHGGIVSSLLDGAMTNCLFAAGQVGLTAELTVRFPAPVLLEHPAVVRARLERSRGRLHLLTAELVQTGEVKAAATAKFLKHPDWNEETTEFSIHENGAES